MLPAYLLGDAPVLSPAATRLCPRLMLLRLLCLLPMQPVV